MTERFWADSDKKNYEFLIKIIIDTNSTIVKGANSLQ